MSALDVKVLAAGQISTSVKNFGQVFPLIPLYAAGGTWTVASNVVTVPKAGTYRVAFNRRATSTSTSTSTPQSVGAQVSVGGAAIGMQALQTRFSVSASDQVGIAAEGLVTIATPGSQGISLTSLATGVSFFNVSQLLIELVG
ncbi:MAG TPA: hypothetical protein VIK01_25715 [Polyangiaceae bacterium]